MKPVHFIGLALLLGPLFLPVPEGMGPAAWRVTGLAALMALWWLTEAVPLAVTALLPLALAPLLGIGAVADVAGPYANPLIFLFLGGFLLALAIEKWGLHHRVAQALLQRAGTDPARVLAALMGATAFLSLWISNTASAMVMAPIAAGLAAQTREPRTGIALMLGVAFAATIGGMGSLIGTPPNALFAAHMAAVHGVEIGFAEWAIVGLPVSLSLLMLAWLMLCHLSPGVGRTPLALELPGTAAGLDAGARRVAVIAVVTASAWILRPVLAGVPGLAALSDAGIAMLAGIALFLVPSGQGGTLMAWRDVRDLRWDVLILFGGGLALAQLMQDSGLSDWIGAQSAVLAGWPLPVVVAGFAAIIVYLGELASNTAMAALFLPVAGAAAASMGVDPVVVLLPVALAASVGFMLPVATPPNAIVFGQAGVTRMAMLRAGAVLDVLGLIVAVGFGLVLGGLIG